MNFKITIKIFSSVSVLVFLWAASPLAQEMSVPVNVQFPLFLKVMVFDRNLKERVGDEIVIGIVYQKKFKRSRSVRDEFVNVMEKSSLGKIDNIPIRQVSINIDESDLENAILENEIDIVYVTPVRALELGRVTGLCREKKITTLTGVTDYIDSGISVSIGIKGKKPRLIINLPAAKAEGANFSSGLLGLAKVIDKF